MKVETTVKVTLTNEEENCLTRALEIVKNICNCTGEYEDGFEFENDTMLEVLEEMQTQIEYII